MKRPQTRTLIYISYYLAALALDIWLVFVLPTGTWKDHAGVLLGIIGIFAFATGFLNATELAKQFPESFLDNLTSDRLVTFIDGNLLLLAISLDFAQAFVWGRDPWTRWTLGWKFALFPFLLLYAIAVISLGLLWLLACFAYLIFVLPFVYLAYSLVSLPTRRIRETNQAKWTPINPYGLQPQTVVKDHVFQLRVFGVGALATFGAIVIKIIELY